MRESAYGRIRRENEDRAARMKAEKVCRTTGRCSVCYRIIAVDSGRSRYTHLCWR